MSLAPFARAFSLATPAVLVVAAVGCGRSELDDGAPIVSHDPPQRAPLSCATPGPGISDCGPDREDCCTTLDVPGGTFARSFDGVSCPGGVNAPPAPALGCYRNPNHPATISSFRLDKYLVTVARFQTFLASARSSGWQPPAGAGRHTHLNGGQGLADADRPGRFEGGWDDAWTNETLFDSPGDSDNYLPNLPINGVTWFQAYAFCLWDGGFLPSEAEWNYAAAGGDEQRVFPWSQPPQSTLVNCAHAAYTGHGEPGACMASGAYLVGAKSPIGDGRWGQADLVGSRPEWTLDWLRDYVDPCVDCAAVSGPIGPRAVRGYSRVGEAAAPHLLISVRDDDSYGWIGFRCARAPLAR
jgi:formylglycine-generating enzyme required for sulfatase activity